MLLLCIIILCTKFMQRITNNTSACASCKHQRKRCTDKCILAPFFPVSKTREFQAVHKIFGVSNVTKIVVSLAEEDRRRAVDSLVWEALCRQREPVLGPYGDYRRICEELRVYKSQFQPFNQLPLAPSGLVYKPSQGLMGWNNNKGIIINEGIMNKNNNNNNSNNNNNNSNNNNNNESNSLNNIFISGNSMVDFCPNYGIPEREKDYGLLLPHQQNLQKEINQQFYITGPYNTIASKSMESTLWEGSS